MAILQKLAVVITGNPLDGFSCFGPFHNEAAAHDWAEKIEPDSVWWVFPLEQPKAERSRKGSKP